MFEKEKEERKKYKPDTQNINFTDITDTVITAATVTFALVVVALAFVYLPNVVAFTVFIIVIIVLVYLFIPLDFARRESKPRVYTISGDRLQLGRVAPNEIEIGTNAMKVNEHLIRVFSIDQYPPEVFDGWLSPVVASKENIAISMHVYPSDPDYVKAQLDMEIGKIDSMILGMSGTDPKAEPLKHYSEQLKGYRDMLISGQTKPFLVEILLALKTKKRRDLEDNTKEMMRWFRGRGAALSSPYLKQDTALMSVHPNGINYLGKFHSFDTYSLKTFFPFSRSTFGTDDGTLYGYTPDGDPIIFSRFKMRTPHMCVAGATRSGKSFQLKYNIWRAYLYYPDMRVFIVDPTQLPGINMCEYGPLTSRLGGQVIKIEAGAAGKSANVINPFDIKSVPSNSTNPLGDKISRVTAFFNTMFKLSQHETAVLEAVLPQAYASVGITEDIDITTYNGESPTFSDIEKALRQFKKEENASFQDKNIADKLARLMHPWAISSFNAQTNVKLNARWITFDISAIRNTPSFAPVAYMVMDFIYGQCVQTAKPKMLLFDECHLILDNEIIRQQLTIFAREMGKYNAALTVASQSAEDFLRYPEGQTIIGNCPVVTLMRHESIGDAMQKYWKFTSAEQTLIRRAATGREGYSEGLVIAENSKARVLFTADPHEHRYITTKPEELQEIAKSLEEN